MSEINNSATLTEEAKHIQTYLDDERYTFNEVTRYEEIFGETFVSTGGVETTTTFCDELGIKNGSLVLDVGCGIGGSAFVMARKYGAFVHGIDLSTNMVTLANQNRRRMSPGVKHRTQFHVEDAVNMEYPKNFYDLIYSRDAIMHISAKDVLYKKLYGALKPGGTLFVSDYMTGETKPNEEFKAYLKGRTYNLISLEEYGETLRNASFQSVTTTNADKYFVEILQKELKAFKLKKGEFLKKGFSEVDYKEITEGWEVKLERVADGYQSWGYVQARKSFD